MMELPISLKKLNVEQQVAILTFSGWEGGRGRENRSALGLGYVRSWFDSNN